MFLHLFTADGRIGAADAGKEQAQVFVNLCGRAYGASWVARNHLLFDGDGRRDTTDEVALGLVHSSQELTGIAAQALHIAALTLGIQRVESQR